MMQTDVNMTHLDASGVISGNPTRIRGYQIAPGGTAGEIAFYDNATTNSGSVRLTLQVTTNTATLSGIIPGEGVRFYTGAYCTLPTGTSITVFYG